MTTHEKFLLISKIVPEVINLKNPKKLKRGQVHNGICWALKIPRSNQNVKLIKAVLAATGIREVIIHGKTYYTSFPPRV